MIRKVCSYEIEPDVFELEEMRQQYERINSWYSGLSLYGLYEDIQFVELSLES